MKARPLVIGINTLTTTARKAGVGEYISVLLDTLPSLAPDWTFVVFTARDNRHMFRLDQPNVREVCVNLSHEPRVPMRLLYMGWQHLVLPRLLKREKIDVIHHPNTMLVRKGQVPAVITIHDLAEFHIPKYSPKRTKFRKKAVWTSVRTCEKVIAVSEDARQDMIRLVGADPSRIIMTHEGFSPRFQRPSEDACKAFREAKGLSDQRFGLFVGTLYKAKNVAFLVDVLARARQTIPDLKLVVAGHDGDGTEEFSRRISSTGVADSVLRVGHVPDEDVPLWYATADVILYPSLFEGFGLPILEAQGTRTPIIASNITSIPEVAGDGAILLDPHDVDGWADAWVRLVSDPSLRRIQVEAGERNLNRFDPDVVGLRVLDVYRSAFDSFVPGA
ncbi:MAG: glycosyltransferase family 4 protein [Fibrobacteria bacterium]|nr:glycosyltransferase family 4 protein [Fibrobacteria bacterium]